MGKLLFWGNVVCAVLNLSLAGLFCLHNQPFYFNFAIGSFNVFGALLMTMIDTQEK